MICTTVHLINTEAILNQPLINRVFNSKQTSATADDSTMTFSEKVAQFDSNFTSIVVRLLAEIHEVAEKDNSEKFVSLSNRINFNQYYNSHLNSRR